MCSPNWEPSEMFIWQKRQWRREKERERDRESNRGPCRMALADRMVHASEVILISEQVRVHSQGAHEMEKGEEEKWRKKKSVIISHSVVGWANAANVSRMLYSEMGKRWCCRWAAMMNTNTNGTERRKWATREQIYDKEFGGWCQCVRVRDKNCIPSKMKL